MPYRHFSYLAAVALVTVAIGASSAPVRADDNAEARVHFERGNRALTRGMNARGARRTRFLEDAVAAYVQSLSIVRSRNVVYNAGVALEALGRDEEAFAYFREYLQDPDISDDERREGTNRLNDIRRRVAVISIQTTPAGADVHIDRRDLAPVGTTPIEVAVSAGPHTVHVSREGYVSGQASVTGSAGQRETVSLDLRAEPIAIVIRAPDGAPLTLNGHPVAANTEIPVMPGDHEIRYGTAEPIRISVRPGEGRRLVNVEAPASAARSPGLLAVSVNVPATIFVDGELVETGREIEASVASGPRTIRVEVDGYAPATSRVDVPADGVVRLEVRLSPDVAGSSRFGKLPGVLLAVGGATALAAAGVGIAAITQRSNYDDSTSATPADADRIESLNLTADILFAAGAGIALVGLLFAVFNADEEQAPSQIELAATPLEGGGLLFARGSWGGN